MDQRSESLPPLSKLLIEMSHQPMRMTSRWVMTLSALLLATVFSGCSAIRMETPKNFVALKSGGPGSIDAGLKFISADEAKVWLREFSVDEDGDLEFWTAAFINDTVEKRGYELLEQAPIEGAAQGFSEGQEMTFATAVDGRPCKYLVTLYVDSSVQGSKIRVLELLAESEPFDEHVAEVRRARDTIR